MLNKIFAILLVLQISFSCKKEESPKPHTIDLYSSRHQAVINGVYATGQKISVIKYDGDILDIYVLGSWTGDKVTLKIYKDLVLVKESQGLGDLKVRYEVQP
jgi:hypothetical protein